MRLRISETGTSKRYGRHTVLQPVFAIRTRIASSPSGIRKTHETYRRVPDSGYEVDQIANDIGMSRQNVDHYMRFRDQMKVATDGQKRLRLIGKED